MAAHTSLDAPDRLPAVLADHYERVGPAVLARLRAAAEEPDPPFGDDGTDVPSTETVARQATCLLLDVLVVAHQRAVSDRARVDPDRLETLARTPTDGTEARAWTEEYERLRQQLTAIPGGGLFESWRWCLCGPPLAETVDVPAALASLARTLLAGDRRDVRPTLPASFDVVAGGTARGCVYTPPAVADLLAAWCVRDGDERVLDPACGGGQLLASALTRLDGETDGRVDGARLVGVDRDPTATDLTALALAAHAVDTAGRPTIRTADFFEVCPPAEDAGSVLPDVDAVVMNPPFTRPEHLDDGYRDAVRDAVFDDADARFSKRAGLYACFLVAATRLLDDGDRLAAVVPSSAFAADYADAIESFLLEHYDIEAVLGTHRHPAVPTAEVNAFVVLLTRKLGRRADGNRIAFCRFDRPFDAVDAGAVATGCWDGVDAAVRRVDQHRLGSATDGLPSLFGHKWTALLRVGDRVGDLLAREADRFVRIGDLARVRYGFKPGAVRFYLLPRPGTGEDGVRTAYEEASGRLLVDHGHRSYAIEHDCWMRPIDGDRTDTSSVEADPSYVDGDGDVWAPRYALKSSTGLEDRVIDADDPDHVLVSSDLPRERLDAERPGFAAHVRWGESQGFHERGSIRSRDPWYDASPSEPGTILLKQFHDRRLFHPVNAVGVVPTNTFQQLEAGDTPPAYLAAYLNSTLGLLLTELFGRTNLGAGALTVYGSDFEAIPIPPVERDVPPFADVLAGLQDAPVRPVHDELGARTPADVTLADVAPARRRLDDRVFDALLGWSEDERLAVYRDLLRLVDGRTAKADNRR
jgi:tRNA1(Val) A37 N6-methylase TrmN6